MRNEALPWILLALVTGAWVGSSLLDGGAPAGEAAAGASSSEIASLRADIAALRAEVKQIREKPPAPGPGLEPPAKKPSSEKSGRAKVRPKPVERPVPPQGAGPLRNQRVHLFYKQWYDDIRSMRDAEKRRETLEIVRESFGSKDSAKLLAALRVARWIGDVKYDRADFRARILPHANAEDAQIRRAAREALARVQPEPQDLPMWIEEAQTADRSNAETTAEFLTLLSNGIIQDEVADAVLHLLRDGTRIKKAFVIRGLQQFKEFDPRVEERLVEIVKSVPYHDYDSGYFFHFITPKMKPKSDLMVDVMLDVAAEGKGSLEKILRGMQTGLSPQQQDRAADRLLKLARNAATDYQLHPVLNALYHVAGPRHAGDLEAMSEDEELADPARGLAKRAADAARRRR